VRSIPIPIHLSAVGMSFLDGANEFLGRSLYILPAFGIETVIRNVPVNYTGVN
jgi:hypothetical protein